MYRNTQTVRNFISIFITCNCSEMVHTALVEISLKSMFLIISYIWVFRLSNANFKLSVAEAVGCDHRIFLYGSG